MNNTETTQWYCLKAKTKREHIAAYLLNANFDMEVFAPRISMQRKTASGNKRFTEALFPGYCFARFNRDTDQRKVVHAQDIRGLVSFGQHVPAISDDTLESLRRQFPADQKIEASTAPLKPGEVVEIIAGTLFGQNAVLTDIDEHSDRVALLIDFLGRDVRIGMSKHHILKPSNGLNAYPQALLA